MPLPLYVIYHPTTKDHPGRYVVRRLDGDQPTTEFTLHDTLADARRSLPPGLVRFERDPSDDPVIIESWL